jgi:hypothetical protein
MKSGNLNFLEPSGPLEACNGTALPLQTYEGTEKLKTYLHLKILLEEPK